MQVWKSGLVDPELLIPALTDAKKSSPRCRSPHSTGWPGQVVTSPPPLPLLQHRSPRSGPTHVAPSLIAKGAYFLSALFFQPQDRELYESKFLKFVPSIPEAGFFQRDGLLAVGKPSA